MFREWGFLITEMIGLLAIAALMGLFIGWLIWGRRGTAVVDTTAADRLREELDKCRALHRDKDAHIADLEADIKEKRLALASASAAISGRKPKAAEEGRDRNGMARGRSTGTRPASLRAPRGGRADDLKLIKGVGEKLEVLCNQLGYFHFDQIAAWTASEVAWVDENLEGFKGRVSRDHWVKQAKVLARGGKTEFSKRVSKGDVY